MSATEILNLPLASNVAGVDYLEVVQSGVSKKVSILSLFGSPANTVDGKTAYQIAVEHGFVGSESEWLESLIGAPGTDGANGPQGLHGPQGIQGPAGPAGATGPQGRIGDTGRAGSEGSDGPQGPQGIQGVTGISAYQHAVTAGFNGTLQQWLDSLKGETGPSVSLAPTEYRQTSASATWTVNHNLGYRPNSVKVLSDGGVEMMVEVIHTSVNQVVIYFDQPTSGYVLYI